MTIHIGGAGLLIGVLLSIGACAGRPSPSSDPLVGRVVAEARRGDAAITSAEATCLLHQARTLGGGAAVVQIDRHPGLHGLRGASGRAVAQAYEACVGAAFVDAFGYEP